jgi:hypothetical protein
MKAKPLESQLLPFQMSLRIRHPSMDPAEISQELSIPAEHSFRAGEPRQSRSGFAATAVHADTYWLATLDPASWPSTMPFADRPGLAPPQKHLAAAATHNLSLALSLGAAHFRTAHSAILRKIRSEGGQATLLIAFSPASVPSFSLTPEVSRVLSDLGITIEFEVTGD